MLHSHATSNLTKEVMEELCRLLSIKARKTIPDKSGTNVKYEIAIEQLGQILKKLSEERDDRKHILRIIEYATNTSPDTKIQFTSFFLQHFREFMLPFTLT